ncbi:thioredoxin family protein [Clostridioides difficile]|nr:thioredoxin family protein [Clostridioides difficile]MCI4282020.1 thioredoxin family protein [Clostridioides difficile]MCP3358843.1 thioredoxin family protein [Clostridioides difficile]MDS6199986.1 thioredoxin family protein [Clostridioides difficile]HBF8218529.1 thioredoxin family protein [Clostridioides difficile]
MVKNKPLIVKILVPALIVAIIVGIFIIKNVQKFPTEPSIIDSGADSDKNFSLKITSVDLEEIKKYGVPTVIDFGSDSCIPCKQMASVLETLNSEWQGKAAVQFMDVWEYTEGVDKFPVQVIPTQVFFNADGTPFIPSDELASKVQFTMYSDKSNDEHIFTVHQGGITEEEMREIFAEMGVE